MVASVIKYAHATKECVCIPISVQPSFHKCREVCKERLRFCPQSTNVTVKRLWNERAGTQKGNTIDHKEKRATKKERSPKIFGKKQTQNKRLRAGNGTQ